MRVTDNYFKIGAALIILSGPLGHRSVKMYGIIGGNLTGIYGTLLEGFIRGYWTVGILVCLMSLIRMYKK